MCEGEGNKSALRLSCSCLPYVRLSRACLGKSPFLHPEVEKLKEGEGVI
jgi:hypothetical protein